MKKLVKIKLVNWHLFPNQTIEINGNVMVSGENGAGKSTLLDALQYILIGGKSGTKFNVAATEDAKRTLEGYIRGRIGAENKENLRNGDVITHICLEFFDETQKISTLVGVVLDLPKLGTLKEKFYILENLSINDTMFLDDRLPRDYKNMKAYLKTQDIEIPTFETQKKYKESLGKFFGMDATKYAKILPKALAFNSLDLQKFVFDFLLDDDPIDIQSLKNNVEQLKKVEAQIKLDREKLAKLDAIAQLGKNIETSKEQLIVNDLLEKMAYVEKRKLYQEQQEDELRRIDQKINELKARKVDVDAKVDENDTKLSSLEVAKSGSNIAQTIATYQDMLTKKEAEFESNKETANQVRSILNFEYGLIKKLNGYIKAQSFKDFTEYIEKSQDNYNPAQLIDLLNQVSKDIGNYKNTLTFNNSKLADELTGESQLLREAQGRLNNLRRNISVYSSNVSALIEIISQKLSEKYQKEIHARPLCELIEVNDETWRNALEGFLGGQRFNLIVEPEYFNDALQIYNDYASELKLFGTGLVNTNKIRSFENIEAGSLASKIDTEFIHARNYVNMLLNSVICVDNVHELKEHRRSITRTCMTYGNFTASQINPKIYQIPYIGQSSRATQIEIEETEVNTLDIKIKALNDSYNKNSDLLSILRDCKSEYIVGQNQLRFLEIVSKNRREIIELQDQIDSIGVDADLDKIQKEIETQINTRRELRVLSSQLASDIGVRRNEKDTIINTIDTVKVKIEEFNKEIMQLRIERTDLSGLADSQFYGLKESSNSNFDKIEQIIIASNTKLNQTVIKGETEIANNMKQYNIAYSFSGIPEFSGLIDYEKECNKIRHQNLIKYEADAIELRKNSETGFKEEFVNKLRASLENAAAQIEELNHSLEGKTFGTDSYKIICKASDDPEYKQYYDIIVSDDSVENNTLFTESLTTKKEAILKELFERIASGDPQYDKLTYQFLDYRNYMSYDIEMNNINGNKTLFSKVTGQKSGGETQVPFYIVIAASFQQLLSRNKRIDSGCVVLFDEAFNKMDEGRIETMMKFYNSLSIQLLIAVPPQKVAEIKPHVTTSLIIIKDDDFAIIQSFNEEKNVLDEL